MFFSGNAPAEVTIKLKNLSSERLYRFSRKKSCGKRNNKPQYFELIYINKKYIIKKVKKR